MSASKTTPQGSQTSNWRQLVKPYERADIGRSVWQVINSVIPYMGLWYVMYLSLNISYWLTLVLSVPTMGFLVRIFIIFHDCGHGAFFKSRRANDIVGFLCGVLTFTPYQWWAYDHAVHHATSGDLDRRGVGYLWTLTVAEYWELPPSKRLLYRVYRYPLVLFFIAPMFAFLVFGRLTQGVTQKRALQSVHFTNLALLALVLLLGWAIGFDSLFLVQLPIVFLAGATAMWLFYVQHQFEDAYWEHHEDWEYSTAALQGSSFYKLPKVLQWFSGNIGFHHIHHLSPRIPNYFLEKCHAENPALQVEPMSMRMSLKTIPLRLWDEDQRMMVAIKGLNNEK
jgi:omega-6 fatty acid desaturase (delta-12 desaturase)